jgi:hypothetical protein
MWASSLEFRIHSFFNVSFRFIAIHTLSSNCVCLNGLGDTTVSYNPNVTCRQTSLTSYRLCVRACKMYVNLAASNGEGRETGSPVRESCEAVFLL